MSVLFVTLANIHLISFEYFSKTHSSFLIVKKKRMISCIQFRLFIPLPVNSIANNFINLLLFGGYRKFKSFCVFDFFFGSLSGID